MRISLWVAGVIALMIATAKAAPPVDLGDGRQPRLAIASDGSMYAVVGRDDGGVYWMGSTDNGTSWSSPARVESLKGKIPLGMRRGPRIVVVGDSIVITAVVGAKGNGQDGDLVAVRSTDRGKSWSEPVAISDAPAAAREGLQTIVSDGKSRLAAAWLDLRDGNTVVMSSVSTDLGRTWQKNLVVYRSPDGHVCECCHPSAAFDSDGTLYVMFRNWLQGNRDMYLAASRDGGLSFSPADKLGRESWLLRGCPMDGGDVAILAGKVFTVWRRSNTIFSASPRQTIERKIDAGRQPALAVTAAGEWIAYIKEGQLWVAPPKGEAMRMADKADFPVLTTAGDSVLCAWEADGRSYVSVMK
jgi:hypothetical protein